MKAFVDRKKCIGCGICVRMSPSVFSLGQGGKSCPIETEVPVGSRDNALKAGAHCPAGAIAVRF